MPEEFREGWLNSWLQKGLRPVESASYTYQDSNGNDIVRKTRFSLMSIADGKDTGEKTFTIHHRTLQSVILKANRWLPGIGQEGWDEDLIYRRCQVDAGISYGEPVFLCEGEKDANNVAKAWGVVTTSHYQGAAGMREAQARLLLGASQICIFVDRDLVGYQLAWHHVNLLVGLGYPGQNIRLGLPGVESPKADMSDHIAAGLGPDRVARLRAERLAAKIEKHGTLSTSRGRWGYGYGGDDEDLGEWVVTRV